MSNVNNWRSGEEGVAMEYMISPVSCCTCFAKLQAHNEPTQMQFEFSAWVSSALGRSVQPNVLGFFLLH